VEEYRETGLAGNVTIQRGGVSIRGDLEDPDNDGIYTYDWDTTGRLPGDYVVKITLTDASNNIATWPDLTITLVDTISPVVTAISPVPNSWVTECRPTVSALLKDSGSGVDATTIQVTVKGAPGTWFYDSSTGIVSYVPSQDLAPEIYTVYVNVMDRAGNFVHYEWEFTAISGIAYYGNYKISPTEWAITYGYTKPSGPYLLLGPGVIVPDPVTGAPKAFEPDRLMTTSRPVYFGYYDMSRPGFPRTLSGVLSRSTMGALGEYIELGNGWIKSSGTGWPVIMDFEPNKAEGSRDVYLGDFAPRNGTGVEHWMRRASVNPFAGNEHIYLGKGWLKGRNGSTFEPDMVNYGPYDVWYGLYYLETASKWSYGINQPDRNGTVKGKGWVSCVGDAVSSIYGGRETYPRKGADYEVEALLRGFSSCGHRGLRGVRHLVRLRG